MIDLSSRHIHWIEQRFLAHKNWNTIQQIKSKSNGEEGNIAPQESCTISVQKQKHHADPIPKLFILEIFQQESC